MKINNLKNKKYLFFAILSLSILFSLNRLNNFSRYNNAKVDNKIIGSKNDRYYMSPLKSLDQVTYFSDLIVKGTVIGETEQQYKESEYILLTEKIKDKPKIPVSLVKFKIDEVIKGEINEDEITILQEGLVLDDESMETKVKPDKNYILFLLKTDFEGKEVYIAYRKEVGVFEINETLSSKTMFRAAQNIETTYSFSEQPELSKYDNIAVDIIREDIDTSLDLNKTLDYDDAVKLYYDFELEN